MKALLCALLVGIAAPGYAQKWVLEAASGDAHNFRTPLRIRQGGSPDITTSARYRTRPTGDRAPYYVARVGRWKDNKAWELEHIHHKLYLENRPAGVDFFLMTFGYNYYLLNRAWRPGPWTWRLGAGLIVTHPESRVRGREFDGMHGAIGPYYFSGVGAQAAAGRSFPLYRKLSLYVEGKLAAAWARIPIKGGNADVPNVSLHWNLGLSLAL